MVYPSEKNQEVQLFIMLSENPSYKKFIELIINKYNGTCFYKYIWKQGMGW